MGIKMSEAFPTKYLSAADLGGREIKLTIAGIQMEDVGDDGVKPLMFFQGAKKGLVLNKTNANNCAAMFGDDTDSWLGKEITLFTAFVDFKGQTVPAIRVKPIVELPPAVHEAAGQAPVTQAPAPQSDPLDDEIPF